MAVPVLECKNVSISYYTRAGEVPAVYDFSLTVNPGEAVGIVTSSNSCGRERGLVLASGQEARCRSLVLASGNQAKNEGSVVAISDKQGTKLQTGEVAVFELRLKHL